MSQSTALPNPCPENYPPGTLFVGFNAVLHPRQVLVFTANFISPPTVGVAICIVLV